MASEELIKKIKNFCEHFPGYCMSPVQREILDQQLNKPDFNSLFDEAPFNGKYQRRCGYSDIMTMIAVGLLINGITCNYVSLFNTKQADARRKCIYWFGQYGKQYLVNENYMFLESRIGAPKIFFNVCNNDEKKIYFQLLNDDDEKR